MDEALTCRSSGEGLVVSGVLTVSSAAALRMAVLKMIADAPPAVIIDVSGVTLGDEPAAMVFSALARHAAAWPAVPLILCGARRPLAETLDRLGIDRHVLLAEHVSDALAASARRPPPPQIRRRFSPVPGSVPESRGLVMEACDRWDLHHVQSSAAMMITELVANAVQHARTAVDMTVTRGQWHLHLAVRDYAPSPARLVGPGGESAPGGRGLLVVDNVATHWGQIPTADGKVVWATVRATGR